MYIFKKKIIKGFRAEPPPLSSQTFDLTTMWYSADWWNSPRFDFDSRNQINVVCFIWFQLISLVINGRVLILKGLFGIHPSFTPLVWFSLGSEHGRHSPGFSRRILSVTFWLAEIAGWLAAQIPLWCIWSIRKIKTYSKQRLAGIYGPLAAAWHLGRSRYHKRYKSSTKGNEVLGYN